MSRILLLICAQLCLQCVAASEEIHGSSDEPSAPLALESVIAASPVGEVSNASFTSHLEAENVAPCVIVEAAQLPDPYASLQVIQTQPPATGSEQTPEERTCYDCCCSGCWNCCLCLECCLSLVPSHHHHHHHHHHGYGYNGHYDHHHHGFGHQCAHERREADARAIVACCHCIGEGGRFCVRDALPACGACCRDFGGEVVPVCRAFGACARDVGREILPVIRCLLRLLDEIS